MYIACGIIWKGPCKVDGDWHCCMLDSLHSANEKHVCLCSDEK